MKDVEGIVHIVSNEADDLERLTKNICMDLWVEIGTNTKKNNKMLGEGLETMNSLKDDISKMSKIITTLASDNHANQSVLFKQHDQRQIQRGFYKMLSESLEQFKNEERKQNAAGKSLGWRMGTGSMKY